MNSKVEVAGRNRPMTYRECREYAAKYQRACLETHSAIRIVKDKLGGWKCKITMHT